MNKYQVVCVDLPCSLCKRESGYTTPPKGIFTVVYCPHQGVLAAWEEGYLSLVAADGAPEHHAQRFENDARRMFAELQRRFPDQCPRASEVFKGDLD